MSDDIEKRWHVTIIYRCETGPVVVDCDITEIEELHDIVESGPDWNSILTVGIELNSPDETVVLQSPIQKGESHE